MKLIEITALCRSGHHAVMNWIVRSITGQQCTWSHKMNLLENGFRILSEANHDIPLSYKFIEEQLSETSILIAGYEDTPWNYSIFSNDNIYRGPLSLNKARSYGFDNLLKIVIIRDFYSNLSSRIKSNNNKKMKNWTDGSPHLFDVGKDYIDRWKNIARACVIGKVSYIKFEDWLSDEQKRREFLETNFSVKDMYGTVEIIGTSSSFENIHNVKDRTGQVEIPEEIKELIRKDNELHYLIGALGYQYKEI
jgi:hypothetical protein